MKRESCVFGHTTQSSTPQCKAANLGKHFQKQEKSSCWRRKETLWKNNNCILREKKQMSFLLPWGEDGIVSSLHKPQICNWFSKADVCLRRNWDTALMFFFSPASAMSHMQFGTFSLKKRCSNLKAIPKQHTQYCSSLYEGKCFQVLLFQQNTETVFLRWWKKSAIYQTWKYS